MRISVFFTAASAVLLAAALHAAPADRKQPELPVFAPLFRADLNPSLYTDEKEAAALFAKRTQLLERMRATRRHIIKTDPAAQAIVNEMLQLSRKLAALMEAKKSIRQFNADLLEIDKEITKLPKKSVKKSLPAAKPPQKSAPAASAKQ